MTEDNWVDITTFPGPGEAGYIVHQNMKNGEFRHKRHDAADSDPWVPGKPASEIPAGITRYTIKPAGIDDDGKIKLEMSTDPDGPLVRHEDHMTAMRGRAPRKVEVKAADVPYVNRTDLELQMHMQQIADELRKRGWGVYVAGNAVEEPAAPFSPTTVDITRTVRPADFEVPERMKHPGEPAPYSDVPDVPNVAADADVLVFDKEKTDER